MPSQKEWDDVIRVLSGTYGYVNMVIDGYDVSVERGLSGKNTLSNVIWINGEAGGKYMVFHLEGEKVVLPEVTRRFYRKCKKNLYTLKHRQRADKELGKRAALKGGFHKKIIFYSYFWNSAAALRRHLLKNNEDIKITKILGV